MNKHKTAAISIAAVLVVGLSGCTPGNNVGGATFVGAASGGILGAALTHGSPIGVLGGALIGGVVGNAIGHQMDATDRRRMSRAVYGVPVEEGRRWEASDVRWENEDTGAHYRVHPVRQTYDEDNGRYCREYQTTVQIGGKTQKAYGKACRMPDGQWKMVS